MPLYSGGANSLIHNGMTTDIEPMKIPRIARPTMPAQMFAIVINEREIQKIHPTRDVMNVVNFLPTELIRNVDISDPTIANNDDIALNNVASISLMFMNCLISGITGDGYDRTNPNENEPRRRIIEYKKLMLQNPIFYFGCQKVGFINSYCKLKRKISNTFKKFKTSFIQKVYLSI